MNKKVILTALSLMFMFSLISITPVIAPLPNKPDSASAYRFSGYGADVEIILNHTLTPLCSPGPEERIPGSFGFCTVEAENGSERDSGIFKFFVMNRTADFFAAGIGLITCVENVTWAEWRAVACRGIAIVYFSRHPLGSRYDGLFIARFEVRYWLDYDLITITMPEHYDREVQCPWLLKVSIPGITFEAESGMT